MEESQGVPPVDQSPQSVPVVPQKKFLISIVIGVSIVMFIVILTTILLKTHRTPVVPATTGATASPTPGVKMVLTKYSSDKWLSIVGTGYTLSYPSDWRAQAGTSSAGVKSVVIRPVGQHEGTFTPSFAVDTYTALNAALAKQETDYYVSALGFTQNSVMLKNQSATRFEGVIPFEQIKGDYVKKNSHNVIYLQSAGTRTFVLRYQYDGKNIDSSYEDFFNQLITTFTPTRQ